MPLGSPSHQPPPPPPPAGPFGPSGAPGASGSSQPPPPPSSTHQESPSKGSAALSPSKLATSAEYQAWMTTDIRLKPSISSTPTDLEMDDDMGLDEQAQLSDAEDIGKPAWSIPSSDAHVPPNNWASALASSYSTPPKDSLLAQTGDMATFIDWFYKSVDDPILRNNVSKPLPLGGPPGQPPPPPPPAGPFGPSGAPRASGSSQPPPPPSSTHQESPSKGSAAPSPSKLAASAEYQAWTTTDIRLKPSISSTPTDLEMDDDMGLDE
nr:hypothetical protein [Tanacetum cinerariifolium]